MQIVPFFRRRVAIHDTASSGKLQSLAHFGVSPRPCFTWKGDFETGVSFWTLQLQRMSVVSSSSGGTQGLLEVVGGSLSGGPA